MFKAIAIAYIIGLSLVSCQDLGGIIGGLVDGGGGSMDIFNGLINQLVGQWGELSPEDWQALFASFQNNGLNDIWHAIGDHCGSNVECGLSACCVKPQITGKRAVTDGSIIHWASYCAPLRTLGQSCSKHDNSQHYYTFQCPCTNDLECKPGKYITLHPLIVIAAESTCQTK